MTRYCFDSPDPEHTLAAATDLGRAIGEDGLAIALIGPLGSGKTLFVKGLAEGLGADPRLVSSPTFVIAQQVPIVRDAEAGRGPHVLHHVDLYRLESETELESMGFFDLFEAGAVLAVEWADRFPGALGPERLDIEWDGAVARSEGRPGRTLTVTAHGDAAESVLADWQRRQERRDRLGGAQGAADRGEPEPGGAASGGGSREGGGGSGGISARRAGIWALWLAGLAGMTGSGVGDAADEVCTHPVAVSEDVWGTDEVRCVQPSEAREDSGRGPGMPPNPEAQSFPVGVGGLLFGRPMDLATVTAPELEALPGIGPSRAEAILAARREAPFESAASLQRVHGIGARTATRLSTWLSASDEGALHEPRAESKRGGPRG